MGVQVKCPGCASLFGVGGWEESVDCHQCGANFDPKSRTVTNG